MASKEEVRGIASRVANNENVSDNDRATLERSTSQAGAEGRLLTRLMGGSKEKTN